jgi:dienelactone hydrolase
MSSISGLFRLVFTSIISRLLPLDDLPKPSGRYAVGFSVHDWFDHSRDEWFTQSGDKRRLVVQVWYPARVAESFSQAPYLDHPQQRLSMVAYQVGLPAWLIDHVQKVRCNAFRDAPRHKGLGSLPLVLFSHGLGGMKSQNSIQAEELASHGYMVVAVDHAYDAYMTIFNDGSVADYRSAAQGELTGEEFRAFRTPQLATRAADLSFILDEITRRAGQSEPLWMKVDTQRVGVFGHSFGGATSIMLAASDARITASAALDGWMLPLPKAIVNGGLTTPFLYIGQGQWRGAPLNYRLLEKLIQHSDGGTVKLFPGTRHFDFSDATQFTKLAKWFGLSGSVSRGRIRACLNADLLDFFNQHVNNAVTAVDTGRLIEDAG